eukprot:TRINITY_DN579_c0_g3_i1.p1 TRINITY_DN579_c0_g3~~TRINITY_DN579_c0_g3_i1.p1  ORF type:complete len:400 (+),score=53.69 TRINITY_DN579_c0_g3_i1:1-1200(+)
MKASLCVFLLFAASQAVTTLHGIYTTDGYLGPKNLDLTSEWLGRSFELAHTFHWGCKTCNWDFITGDVPDWNIVGWGQWVNAKPGRNIVISMRPLAGDNDRLGPDGKVGTSDDVSLAQCANGNYNNYYVKFATNMVKNGMPNAIMRVGWEFNNDWSWGAKGNEQSYAACFRQVVTAMRSVANSNFKFDWNVDASAYWWDHSKMDLCYPGDAYVDYISCDTYDASWAAYPYPSPCDDACKQKSWQTAWNDYTHGLFYMRDYAKSHGKYFAIPEWGVWTTNQNPERGGLDNAWYIEQMYNFITDPNNNVGYEIYFNIDAGDGLHRISDTNNDGTRGFKTTFPNAAAKYKQLFSTLPPYTGDNTPPAITDNYGTFPKLQGNSAPVTGVCIFLLVSVIFLLSF